MLKRILILDVGLLVLLVLAGVKLRRDWQAFDPAHDLALIQPAAQAFPALPVTAATGGAAADWTEIPARNVFSFDRSDIDIVAATPAEPPKPSAPKPVLFGTIFLDKTHQMALLASGPSGRNYREMKVGEEIDGWKVVEIQNKSVVVESLGVRETVIMNDPSARIPRDGGVRTASASAPTIITTGQPPASGVASPTVSSPSPSTGAPVQAPTSAPSGPGNALELFGGKQK